MRGRGGGGRRQFTNKYCCKIQQAADFHFQTFRPDFRLKCLTLAICLDEKLALHAFKRKIVTFITLWISASRKRKFGGFEQLQVKKKKKNFVSIPFTTTITLFLFPLLVCIFILENKIKKHLSQLSTTQILYSPFQFLKKIKIQKKKIS